MLSPAYAFSRVEVERSPAGHIGLTREHYLPLLDSDRLVDSEPIKPVTGNFVSIGVWGPQAEMRGPQTAAGNIWVPNRM